MNNKILIKNLLTNQIDEQLTTKMLLKLNRNSFTTSKKSTGGEIPHIDGKQIIDCCKNRSLDIRLEDFQDFCKKYKIDIEKIPFTHSNSKEILLDSISLKKIGILLYPFLGYGVLNGGSATSYYDKKKNNAVNPIIYNKYEPTIDRFSKKYKSFPKGITPAFIYSNGSEGPTFIELKLRSLLIESLRYQILSGEKNKGISHFFQMTSVKTDPAISQALKEYKKSPYLEDLIKETGIDITEAYTASQHLMAAFTLDEKTKQYEIFDQANGIANTPLGLPGGHGQNFLLLKDIYLKMYNEGKRFAYLGNVDNSGFFPEPKGLALLALSGKPAAFEFTIKTPVDLKGGVLLRNQNNHLNCVDMGVGIEKETVDRLESEGKTILFNAANGLFNLEYLINNIDRIIENLPSRVSKQVKDAGTYYQVEQVTWEVIGLIKDPLIFAVDKYSRFLPSKMFIEELLMSGYLFDEPELHENLMVKEQGLKLKNGMDHLLSKQFMFKYMGKKWEARSVSEIKKILQEQIKGEGLCL